MSKPYTVEKKKHTYIARFWGGIARPLKAVSKFQDDRMAEGIAKANNWKVQSVGRAA